MEMESQLLIERKQNKDRPMWSLQLIYTGVIAIKPRDEDRVQIPSRMCKNPLVLSQELWEKLVVIDMFDKTE